MTSSLVYRSAWLYEFFIMGLYGRHYAARYRAIADLIPGGCRVLDLCCGPGVLFDRHLRHRHVDYMGLDINARFIDRLNRRGARARLWDLREDRPLPEADVVIMQASLYQFLPDPAPVLGRMLRAARRRVILAEPIRNLADSRNPLLAAVARRQTDPGDGAQPLRFTEATLDAFLARAPARPRRSFLIPGGREKVYLIETGPEAEAEAGAERTRAS